MKKSQKIRMQNLVNALKNAGNGEIVFSALHSVPTENLEDIIGMINAILLHRRKEHGESH
jgi:hypothetical protein